jgi:glycosyltransferase involved in cell wall biosynthesis
VTYIPEAPEAAEAPFGVWIRTNAPRLLGKHVRLLLTRPLAYLRTFLRTCHYSLRYRTRSRGFAVKTVFFKDFLRAGYIAWHVLSSGRVGHLHGHFCHGSTTMTMLTSQLTGLPFSFTAHAKDIYLPKLNPGDLLQHKIRSARFVVTCTDANRTYLQQLCPDVTSIHTIYHGLDTTVFIPGAQEAPPLPVILSVGRFVEKKGFPFLIHACHILKTKGYRFRCRIIGEADEHTPVITQLIHELQLEDTVCLEEAVPQDLLRQIYREATIFALPCHIVRNGDRDGIPNVLVEAMATGLPVVSTAISGIPELVEHHIDGMLIPQQDWHALADALGLLLRDSALRRQLGKNARDKVCRLFDNTQTTLKLKALFESSLGRPGGARL